MTVRIKTEGNMGYSHIDKEEIELIKKHIIKGGDGSVTINSVTLNCLVIDKGNSYPSQGLEYPLKTPITITKD